VTRPIATGLMREVGRTREIDTYMGPPKRYLVELSSRPSIVECGLSGSMMLRGDVIVWKDQLLGWT
jgi:hypothetical protein